jgi:hypothetical protein
MYTLVSNKKKPVSILTKGSFIKKGANAPICFQRVTFRQAQGEKDPNGINP